MRHLLLLPLLLLAVSAPAQTLARKNWAGSGITVEPWYQSAIFYQVDPLTFQDSNGDGFGDLAGLASRLPYLAALGVDALLLSPLPLNPPGSPLPLDPLYGNPDDFDRLEREANASHIRLVVDLPLDTPHLQLLATARFWLNRGVAGLRLSGPAPDSPQTLRELRAIAGPTRILLGDPDPGPALAFKPSRHNAPSSASAAADITFDRRLAAVNQPLTPALLRAALAGQNLLADAPNLPHSFTRLGDGTHNLALARIVAAALLLGRGAPLLTAGQELGVAGPGDPAPMPWGTGAGSFTTATPWLPPAADASTTNVALEEADPDSLLHWYRRLAQLHHDQAAIRTGTLELLPTPNPEVVAWLRRPRNGSGPALLVLANLSARATLISLNALLPTIALTPKVLLRSTPAPSPATSAATLLEPFGIYIGAMYGHVGLEAVPQAPRIRRRR